MAQRFNPAALLIPMYLILSALGLGGGGKVTQELSGEVLETRLARLQARCPILDVTLFRHCDAIALFAFSLARCLAVASILKAGLPAQALSSPRRSTL